MSTADLPLFDMLRSRMRWHSQRQALLAENVANADTPGFRPRDLAPLEFSRLLASSHAGTGGPGAPAQTDQRHLAGLDRQDGRFAAARQRPFETTPRGNGVSLEEEMIRVGQNALDHQAAASLYQRGLGLLRQALGRR